MILTFTASLPRDYFPDDVEPWKATFELDENTSLEAFHEAIQEAVGFNNDHLFAFYIAKSERSQERTSFDDEQGGLNQSLGDLFPLAQGLRLFYLFDFGDEWVFKISKSRKKPRTPEEGVEYPRVVKEVGNRPEQYPDWDEDEDEDEDEDFENILGELATLNDIRDDFVLPPVPLPDVQEAFTMPIMQSQGIGLFEAAGFTLAAISAPKFLSFSEWAPQLFNDEVMPAFSSATEAEKVSKALMALWNHWADNIGNAFGIPPECSVDDDNHPSDALREFCDGYLKAHSWLETMWSDMVFKDVMEINPEEEGLAIDTESKETLDILMTYAFLSDTCDFYSSSENDDQLYAPDDELLEDLFQFSFNLLPALMLDVALFGRQVDIQNHASNFPASFDPAAFAGFGDAFQDATPSSFSKPETSINPDKVGRNDPCPCGSGKKFKKCCLH